MHSRITAVFPQLTQAQDAIADLRKSGLNDQHLSVVAQALEPEAYPVGSYVLPSSSQNLLLVEDDSASDRAVKGLLGGAGVGALFGLAAAMIPGAGPFIAAGALATALGSTGGAMTAGAIVGATSGAIASALTTAGWTSAEAQHYGSELESGRVMLTVDVDENMGLTPTELRAILTRHGGRLATVGASL